MTENQIAKSRQRLERFLLDLLEPIGRSERRHWGELYVRGLLQDGERKSIEPMAARLPDGNVQAMQQFVGQSPWEWQEVWARLGKRMTAELEPDSAWVVDDTGFPKQGEDSVGVDRQYSGTLGKTGSCQVAVSLHHVGEQGNAVLGWRLYLPETWTKDMERRQAAGVPEDVVFKKKWELALDLIDQVRDWPVPDRIVLADAGYGEATEFRDALEERGLRYAVGIAPQVGVWPKAPKNKVPEYSGRGAPPKKWEYGDQRPSSVKDLALKAKGWKKVRWRAGSKGWLESRFLAIRVQPSHGFVHGDPPHKETWLLVEWPEEEKEPTKYFFCDLPASYTLRRLVRNHQMPVEDRTRLPPTQGGTRLGSLRRKKLEWLAPPCDARDVGALLPDPRNVAHQKKTSGWTLPRTRREIQYMLFTWTGTCAYCGAAADRSKSP